MRKFLMTLLMGTLAFNFSYADGDKQKQEHKKDFKDLVKKELNLTSQQSDQLEAIHQKYEGDLTQLKNEKRNLKKELKDMVTQNEKGEDIQNRLSAKHDELQNVKRQYEDKKFQMKLEAREILTTDQIAKLDDVFEKKHKYKHGYKHKRQAQEEDQQKQEESEAVQQQDEAESVEAQEQQEVESSQPTEQQEEVEEESL